MISWSNKFLGAMFLALLTTLGWLVVSLPRPALAQQDGPDCAEFVRDVTVPKGSIAYPGERFEKVWLVRNCGESEWIGYRVINTTNDNAFSIPATAPKTEVEVLVEFNAPMRSGNYVYVYGIIRPNVDPRRIVRIGEPLLLEFLVAQFIEVYLDNENTPEIEIKIEVEE